MGSSVVKPLRHSARRSPRSTAGTRAHQHADPRRGRPHRLDGKDGAQLAAARPSRRPISLSRRAANCRALAGVTASSRQPSRRLQKPRQLQRPRHHSTARLPGPSGNLVLVGWPVSATTEAPSESDQRRHADPSMTRAASPVQAHTRGRPPRPRSAAPPTASPVRQQD